MAKVLILDRSKSMRNTLRERLEYEGFSTEAVDNENAAAQLCGKIPFDIILAGAACKLPETDIPFIVLADDASIDSAVEAVRRGGPPEAAAAGRTAAPRQRRARPARVEQIIGDSERISRVKRLIEKVAPCEARVLITGENGTGKELVARWLHAKSSRAAAPFVEVNCAAIPSELIESELFGHERGAFTSAVKQRKGKFEQADGGTLFMDGIGEMSVSNRRGGSDKDVEVDVRVLAATNKNLREEIARGNFREDLYHRIGVVVIKVPPLRERSEDIPALIAHFVRSISAEYRTAPKRIDDEAIAALQAMPWTGNIRELRNVIERLIILSEERITADDVKLYC